MNPPSPKPSNFLNPFFLLLSPEVPEDGVVLAVGDPEVELGRLVRAVVDVDDALRVHVRLREAGQRRGQVLREHQVAVRGAAGGDKE